MDLVVYQPVGTLSIEHDFLSSWDCLLAPSPDALCELSWHFTQCSVTSLKAACAHRLKKEIQGPERLSWCLKGHTRFRATCGICWGTQGFRGSDSWQNFYGKDDQIHPSLHLSPPSTRRNGGGNKRPWQTAKDRVIYTVPQDPFLSVHKCAQSQWKVWSSPWTGLEQDPSATAVMPRDLETSVLENKS